MTVAPGRHVVVVDGSNLATEGRTTPSLRQLDEAVRAYAKEDPSAEIVVVVDASFEHRVDPSERQQLVDAELHGEVVSPPAGAIGRGDAFVLRIAERTGARVLSNDSFQEFHGEHPWLFEEGRLVGGKPVPGVGWIFTPRIPVRGPKSREATGKSKRKEPKDLSAPLKAAELAKAAKKLAARKAPPALLADGSTPKVGDVWPMAPAPDGRGHEGKRKRKEKGATKKEAAPEQAGTKEAAPDEQAGTTKAAPDEQAGTTKAAPDEQAGTTKAAVTKKAPAAKKAPAVKKAAPDEQAGTTKAAPDEQAGTTKAAVTKKAPAAKKAPAVKKAVPAEKAVAEKAVATKKTLPAKTPSEKAVAGEAPTRTVIAGAESVLSSAAKDPAVQAAIGQALAEVIAPVPEEPTDGAARRGDEKGGKGGTKRGRHRRRAASPSPAVNEPLAFITFVATYPLDSELEGEVVSFTSHGAMVDVALPEGGVLHAYIPLTAMGDPPPTKARQVLKKGERRSFVLVALDPPRRVAELALPELVAARGARAR
ncbi:MAG: hypothetical protein M0Z46_15945 [Actinomycetota bacterium]|nr:hypothetical protein [Actinomycetota bacterium]